MPLINLILSFISLMAFWVIMSGYLDAIHISMGVVSVLLVMITNYQIKKHQFYDDDMLSMGDVRFGYAFYYVFWLLGQIISSGFTVAFIILKPTLNIHPSIVRFKVDLPSSHAKMILGNSITLTPGTLTVDIQGDEFIVHSLVPASYQSLKEDVMPRKVLHLFEKEDRPVISDFRVITKGEELA